MSDVSIANTTAGVSAKTVVCHEVDGTTTGLHTYQRAPSAPFAVQSGSAKVTNLDADKLDGQDGPSSTIVGVTDTQSLSNKTLDNSTTLTVKDANFTVQDDADPTKQAKFDAAGITASTTRTYTLPDASTTLVGADTTQTLTNKTLTAPTLATPTLSAPTVTGLLTLTGGQAAFPATQSPSSDANTLDDYEEGSWTPTIGGSGGQSGQAYSSQVGRYLKIGKLVWANFSLTLSTLGTITSSVQLKGLPFTADNVSGLTPICSLVWSSTTSSFVNVIAQVNANTTTATIFGLTGAATNFTALVQGDLAATSILVGTIVYQASA